MRTADKATTADILLEKPMKVRVGWKTFTLRPITLGQIWEMGVFANDIKEPDWADGTKVNIIQELFKHSNDAKLMCEIFIVCAFRKKIWRKVWGRYIRKRLTVLHFNELIKFISNSFNANFFLTSITFLSQTKKMTEATTTARGQQLGE